MSHCLKQKLLDKSKPSIYLTNGPDNYSAPGAGSEFESPPLHSPPP